MEKVEFFLIPIEDRDASDIQEIEKDLYEYCLFVEEISDDKKNKTYDFYDYDIVKDVPISDYLFSDINGISEDTRNFLIETTSKISTSDINSHEIIELINSENNHKYKVLIGLSNNEKILNSMLYMTKKEEYLKPIRYYILNSEDIEEFSSLMEEAYPDLYFNDRILDTMKALKPITNHVEELNRHLSALNDDAKKIYIMSNKSSDEFYRVFNSKHNIIVSGRGGNEGLDDYICEFKDVHGISQKIRCNPHTKLYAKHSDYRIYFNFGRDNIEDGKILIGHIGNHWRK